MLEREREPIAGFVLEHRIGAGSYADVWLAHDRVRNDRVAIKMAPAGSPSAVAALEREYETLRALEHPNILPVYSLERTAQAAYMVMQYAPGDATQLRGASVREILRVAVGIAEGLAFAHAHGVLHRDIKPSNILLSAQGVPKISDFGIAKHSAMSAAEPAGSPFSISPQTLDGAPAAIADDVYAFGTLLYELLSGYPPFYPNADLQRIKFEAPAPLPSAIPNGLAQLVDRMLAKSPQDRPATMKEIASELKRVVTDENNSGKPVPPTHIEPPSARAGSALGEPLRGEWRRASITQSTEQQLRSEGLRRGLAISAIVVGILAVFVVFFVLPRWVDERAPVPAAQDNSTPPTSTTEVAKRELDFAALAKAKQAAEEVRAALEPRLQKLIERAAEQWGADELQRAQQALASGDADVQAREYQRALEYYQSIEPLLSTLEGRATEVLRAQVDAGQRALGAGRSMDAKQAFELALKIEPANAAATQGLKRAGTLDEVLELLGAAARAERDAQPQVALDQYRKALALDPQAPGASAGIARIEAQQSNAAFASAMARGFSALAQADAAGARRAFEDAGKIRPNSAEVAQALRQIEQEQRTGIIGTKLRAAQRLEEQEQWAQALIEYRSVLELDSTVAAANDGVSRVQPRAALNEQLELYLTQPERLFSQSVRSAARDTLQSARAVGSPGPVLAKQISTLSDWLTRADVPVAVALQSDNQTQVTIYRVGTLGTFEQRSLELAPGTYTVVGTRPGYRDVRRQVDVVPGEQVGPIIIRCEEKI
jgi:tetratricopeptide (TPR) repeat protein